jgi:23S rRNA pseudouridine1911/1915/1917 synthase
MRSGLPTLKRTPLRPTRRAKAGGVDVYLVPPYAHRFRLDAFLTKVVGGRSRSEWQRMLDLGVVLHAGRRAKPSLRVEAGDQVTVLPLPEHVELRPQADIPLDVIYEDSAMVVINKPAGLVVHPAPGHEQGTLVNALLSRFPEMRDPTGQLRPGIVHRLDRDTSGLLVIGKTVQAVAQLQEQLKDRSVEKRYSLLLHGRILEEEGLIDAPIGRDLRNRQKMSVRADGRLAQTAFRVMERLGDFCLVDANLLTGRTHQLRVHFAFIGHPVAGDVVYGRRKFPPSLKRQFVHAREMHIRSPSDDQLHHFHADLPTDLTRVLDLLRRELMPGSADVSPVPGARRREPSTPGDFSSSRDPHDDREPGTGEDARAPGRPEGTESLE